ncbi:hypothetical protein GQ55_3G358100 [Panicum hallii var. hallii]|uniref:Uncharacterized protein n=1 Tax=Panicum hallii var. hallii TaxID=1504633 RepID=A0A2T7EFZ9_9POAL|nr:hypothetical protein GQ55_3G358100 [Panicum hallii var. hallii]
MRRPLFSLDLESSRSRHEASSLSRLHSSSINCRSALQSFFSLWHLMSNFLSRSCFSAMARSASSLDLESSWSRCEFFFFYWSSSITSACRSELQSCSSLWHLTSVGCSNSRA